MTACLLRQVQVVPYHHHRLAALGAQARQRVARETEILQLVAEGSSNPDVARLLWITKHTVKFHLASLMTKLGVHSRVQAAVYDAVVGIDRRYEPYRFEGRAPHPASTQAAMPASISHGSSRRGTSDRNSTV